MTFIRYSLALAIAFFLFHPGFAQPASHAANNNALLLSGTITNSIEGDSMHVMVTEQLVSIEKLRNIPHKKAVVPIVHGKFQFPGIACTKLAYCNVILLSNRYGVAMTLVRSVLVAPGDNITLTIANNTKGMNIQFDVGFHGRGMLRWKALYDLSRQEAGADQQVTKICRQRFNGHPIDTSIYFDYLGIQSKVLFQLVQTQQRYLAVLRTQLGSYVHDVMLANAKGHIWKRIFDNFYENGYRNFLIRQYNSLDSVTANNFQRKFWIFYWKHLAGLEITNIPDEELSFAAGYVSFINYKQKTELDMMAGRHLATYYILKERNAGKLRDRMLTAYLFREYEYLTDGDAIMQDALNTVQDEYCLSMLQNLYDKQHLGADAFNFHLPDPNGKMVSLSDYKGKIVFLDFWFTSCTGCTRFYINELSKVQAQFKKDTNVVFISISIDRDRDMWLHTLNRNTHTSAEAVNLYTNGAGANSTVIEKYNVSSYPRPVIIDRDGKIAVNDDASTNNANAITENITRLLLPANKSGSLNGKVRLISK